MSHMLQLPSGCARANSRNGIYLEDSPSNSISGNNVSNNGYGVVLEFYSNNNTVSGNNITANNYYGIELYSSCSENSINRNNITVNNAFGIWIDYSSSNIVYHNNFNNTQQVESHTSTNVWEGGYPSGGNYWIDYNGTDANHDGIGDTPYIINANNADHYPLMTMIPEFPSFLILPLFFTASALTVAVYRTKHSE
jgi:parallel beta-helix repeat protein